MVFFGFFFFFQAEDGIRDSSVTGVQTCALPISSNPFMKETGPEAVPPPWMCSFEERSDEKFVPVPEPHLKRRPSVFARFRIPSIVSDTELMKHAEHWGFVSTPQLNQTGLLKEAFWWRSR